MAGKSAISTIVSIRLSNGDLERSFRHENEWKLSQ
jgi:hypothetical protein